MVFESDAADLVDGEWAGTSDIFFLDRSVGRVGRVSLSAYTRETMRSHPAISADGRMVVYQARDPDASPPRPWRVYRASLDEAGVVEALGHGYRPVVSGDGRVVAYMTLGHAGARTGIGVHTNGATRVVGQIQGQGDAHPADGAGDPGLSADGQWITYVSRATNLIGGRRLSGRSHVYLEHVEGGRRYLVSATARNEEANGESARPALDGTGTRIVFDSTATNLGCDGRGALGCAPDINLVSDIFVWDRRTARVTRVNAATHDLPWLEISTAPSISGDGHVVTFLSGQPVNAADGRDTFDLFLTRH
jgi:Tol biopolymer transport system component